MAKYILSFILYCMLAFAEAQVVELSPNNQTNFTLSTLSYQQIINIQNPKAGSIVYDTTSKSVRQFDGLSWNALHRKPETTPELTAAWKPRSNNSIWANEYAIDNDGNIYLCGTAYDVVYFDNGITITPSNNYVFFLVKYSPEGKALWTLSSTGSYGNIVDIEIGTDSKIYLAIRFNGSSLSFGSYFINNLSSFDNNGLVMKIDLNGNIEWTNVLYSSNGGFPGQLTINELSLDTNNNVYLCGDFNSQLSFNNSSDILAQSGGYNAGFYVKYNSQGVYQWSKKIQGNQTFTLNDIKPAINGKIYLAASFSGQYNSISSAGETDFLLIETNNLGNINWTKREGDTKPENSIKLAIVNNQILVAGLVTAPSNIGGFQLTSNLPLSINHRTEFFYGLFNPETQTWSYVKKSENAPIYGLSRLRIDSENKFYLSGTYIRTLTLDNRSISCLNNTLSGAFYFKGKISTGEILHLNGYSNNSISNSATSYGKYKESKHLYLGSVGIEQRINNFILTTVNAPELFIGIMED